MVGLIVHFRPNLTEVINLMIGLPCGCSTYSVLKQLFFFTFLHPDLSCQSRRVFGNVFGDKLASLAFGPPLLTVLDHYSKLPSWKCYTVEKMYLVHRIYMLLTTLISFLFIAENSLDLYTYNFVMYLAKQPKSQIYFFVVSDDHPLVNLIQLKLGVVTVAQELKQGLLIQTLKF